MPAPKRSAPRASCKSHNRPDSWTGRDDVRAARAPAPCPCLRPVPRQHNRPDSWTDVRTSSSSPMCARARTGPPCAHIGALPSLLTPGPAAFFGHPPAAFFGYPRRILRTPASRLHARPSSEGTRATCSPTPQRTKCHELTDVCSGACSGSAKLRLPAY